MEFDQLPETEQLAARDALRVRPPSFYHRRSYENGWINAHEYLVAIWAENLRQWAQERLMKPVESHE